MRTNALQEQNNNANADEIKARDNKENQFNYQIKIGSLSTQLTIEKRITNDPLYSFRFTATNSNDKVSFNILNKDATLFIEKLKASEIDDVLILLKGMGGKAKMAATLIERPLTPRPEDDLNNTGFSVPKKGF